MTFEELSDYIACGREIEFEYQQHKYSITYGESSSGGYISFCEFYKETLDVNSAKELWKASYNGISIKDMLLNLSPESIWLY